MIKLNRLIVLFCFSSSVNVFSQTSLPVIQTHSPAALPEVLLSFDAIINDKKVELTWSSNTEHNNNFFTVEKSKDAISFEEVTTIKSFGNYSSIISYFEVDFLPYEGISYYRLKQTDPKGKVLSSRLISVNYRFSNEGLAIYPTSEEERSSALMGLENKEILVVLRNEKGQESVSKVVIDDRNEVVISGDEENKPATGTYLIVASSNNKLYSKKVTVR